MTAQRMYHERLRNYHWSLPHRARTTAPPRRATPCYAQSKAWFHVSVIKLGLCERRGRTVGVRRSLRSGMRANGLCAREISRFGQVLEVQRAQQQEFAVALSLPAAQDEAKGMSPWSRCNAQSRASIGLALENRRREREDRPCRARRQYRSARSRVPDLVS
jgi:hypothetical protein